MRFLKSVLVEYPNGETQWIMMIAEPDAVIDWPKTPELHDESLLGIGVDVGDGE
jgi:hypothetical protein